MTVTAADRPMPAQMGWHPWYRRQLDRGEPVELPESARVEGPNGAFVETEISREGRTLTARRTVVVPLMRVSPEGYPALVNFARTADVLEGRALRVRLGGGSRAPR